ncbi:MAG: radical SAM protein [Planctomycetota bacterium]
MTTIDVPAPVSGGLLLSYRCSCRCRHCMYACSPDWEADWIGEDKLERGLSVLSDKIIPAPAGPDSMGLNHGLHFTGGEPFLNYELLCSAVEMADEKGIPSLFVETNAFWCTDKEEAEERLRHLKALGLKGMMISVNPFYAEYVPFERTQRCIEAGADVFGRHTAVYQQNYYVQFQRMGLEGTLSLEDYLERAGTDALTRGVEMFLMGRAARELREYYPHHPAHTFFGGHCRPPVLRPWHNHFDNYGNYLPGYCGGISLGNWLELDDIIENGIDADEHPVLAAILSEDLKELVEFARGQGYEEREGGYMSRCDVCIDARKYLAETGDYEELQPREFYRQID